MPTEVERSEEQVTVPLGDSFEVTVTATADSETIYTVVEEPSDHDVLDIVDASSGNSNVELINDGSWVSAVTDADTESLDLTYEVEATAVPDDELRLGGTVITTDDEVDTGETSVTVEQAENNPPSADAGTNQTDEEGDTVTLDGTGSSDPDGDTLSYSWTQTAGPDISLTDPDTATPEFTAPEVDSETDLTFELTVTDGEASDTDTTTVTVIDSMADGPPPIIGDDPPQDLDDDGLYEDINGDGDFSIGDVQVFFQNRNSDVVQDNAEYFNFSEANPSEVTIGDVQALFQQLTE